MDPWANVKFVRSLEIFIFVQKFVNYGPKKFYNIWPRSELLAPRCPNTMTPENPEVYPLSSINTVSVSTNLNDLSLLFSGGQSGLGRIHHLALLDS